MEIKCKVGCLPVFECVLNTAVVCEDTAELLIPDAMPDVSDLLLTDGQAVIRGKDMRSGGVTVSGIAELTVLYRTEAGETEKLSVDVPFEAEAGSGCEEEVRAVASVRLSGAEARLLSPRKLLVRAEVCVTVSLWKQTELRWLEDAETEGCSVELLREKFRLSPSAAVEEKTFTSEDVQPLPAGKPPVDALLYARAVLRPEAAEPVGGKLVVRGNAAVTAVYRTAGGDVAQAELSQPWSAFPELPESDGEQSFETIAALTGCSVEAESGGFRISVGGVVQTVIRSSRELQPITDAYGTDCRLVPMLETTVLDADAVRETVTDTVSVRLDSLRKVRTIMCLTADCGRPRAEKDSVRVPVSVKAVCMMEDGKPELLTGRGEALCPGSGSIPEATAGEPYVSVTALGLEVRVPVSFSVTRCSREELRRLISAEAVSFEPREPTPSVTILRASQGDSVWSLGKARSLPCASIRAYNQLQEGEEPTPGTLLLLAR